MDAYVALTHGADPNMLPTLLGREDELVIHEPDHTNGYVLEGSEAAVSAAIEALQSFSLVRFYVIL